MEMLDAAQQLIQRLSRLASIRPLSPSTWPMIGNLTSTSSLVTRALNSLPLLGFGSNLLGLVIATTLTCLIYMLYREFDRRNRLMRDLFSRYNIPHARDTNLISGNTFELIIPNENAKLLQLKHKELGETFGLFYGPQPWIFTTNLGIIERLFVTDGNKYIDATQYGVPFSLFHESIAQVQGDRWRRLRKAVAPAFTLAKMKADNVLDDIAASGELVIDSIESMMREEAPDMKPSRIVNLLDRTKRFSAEVIMRIGFGTSQSIDFYSTSDQLIGIIEEAGHQVRHPITWLSIWFPELQPLLCQLVGLAPIGRQIQKITSALSATINNKMASLGRTGQPIERGQRKMIDTLIESHKLGQLSQQELMATSFLFFLAGFETTANTLAITLWHLAKHPTIQDQLRDEICHSGQESQLLHWCILETLRLFPAVPLAIGRHLKEDIEINGTRLPKGTTVNANIYSLHHDSRYWGDDAEQFKPNRFERTNDMHPCQFFAFAMGPRNCLGGNLAMIEMKSLICRLMLKYRLVLCQSSPQDIHFISPNLIHMIVKSPLNIRLIDL